jgi:hypothetical protein
MEDELELGEGNREERKENLGLGLDKAALYRDIFSPGW